MIKLKPIITIYASIITLLLMLSTLAIPFLSNANPYIWNYTLTSIFNHLAFIFFILLLNSYKFFYTRHYILIVLSNFYFFCYYLEFFNYYISGMTFYNAFWDLLNIDFMTSSISVYFNIFIIVTLLSTLQLTLVYVVLKQQNKLSIWYKTDKVYKFLLLFILFIFLLASSSPFKLLKSYIYYSLSKEVRSVDYYTQNPNKEDIIVNGSNNKNVVHIILESYAKDFVVDKKFENLTPNLRELLNQGIILDNLEQVKDAQYSEAGNIMANKGLLPYISKYEEDYGITYILKKAGYNTIFMRGAESSAGGFKFKNLYSKANGVDEYWYLNKFIEADIEADFSNWGISDGYLFEQALNKYKYLQNQNKPFYLGLFTIDTHIDQGLSKKCEGNITKLTKNDSNYYKLLNGVACTDYVLGEFINELKKLPDYENTLILIHADHMPLYVNNLLAKNDNKQFGLILNSNNKAFIQNKTTYIFDIPQTIKTNLDIKTNYKFLLGEDITKENFVRTKKTNRDNINKTEDIDLDDLSSQPFNKIMYKVFSFFYNDPIYY